MKFAKDAEGKRIKPFKHGRGICPVCESTVIARCGTKRAHHWAHEVLAKCEYSEYEHTHETPWHINWKNQFPEDWQEVILHALDGEKHISDVRTPHRLTIEFQHSPISEEERISREKYYSSVGSMVWVVDGTRNKNDWEQFYKNRMLRTHVSGMPENVTFSTLSKSFISEEWLNSNAVVVYDFMGCEANGCQPPEERKKLVCIIRDSQKERHWFITLPKEIFIALCQTNELWMWLRAHLAYPTGQPAQAQVNPAAVWASRIKPNRFSTRRPSAPSHIYDPIYRELGIIDHSSRYTKRSKRNNTSRRRTKRR